MGLMQDPVLERTTFVVIDFEATTPAGYPAQPIEVAAQAMRLNSGEWMPIGGYESLMQPPDFAPLTPMVTAATGITAAMLAQAPTPAEALGRLDGHLDDRSTFLLVAQHASTEGNLIYRHRDHCPRLASIDLLDTIPLARKLAPGLANYSLDTLLAHFSIPRPADRHRAMADVRVTAELFRRLVTAADVSGTPASLRDLTAVAGRRAKANEPTQEELFSP